MAGEKVKSVGLERFFVFSHPFLFCIFEQEKKESFCEFEINYFCVFVGVRFDA